MDKHFRSGRASGDGANELIINIKTIRIVNWGCAVKCWESTDALLVTIHPLIPLFSLSLSLTLLSIHFLLSFIVYSPCTSFPDADVLLLLSLSFSLSFPVIPLLLLWLYQLKWNTSLIWASLPLPELLVLSEPLCWSGWKSLSIERHELASWIFLLNWKRVLHIERADPVHTCKHAAHAFYRPLNHTRPSARIHQIICHHCAMSDGLKMLPVLLEELPGELRREGWILNGLDVMWVGGGPIILFAWKGKEMERRGV